MTIMTPKALLTPLIVSAAILGVGCSSSDKSSPTIAAYHDAPETVSNETSRNNGAWGAVYMSRDELRDKNRNIVDDSQLPDMKNDPSLKKWEAKFEGKNAFVTTNGEKLFHDSCAGCHMHKGEGAIGAGYYPPLANNSKMESKYYIIDILINGFRGMPSFHMMMDDEQMAAVTQYVHSTLNPYKDKVTAEDVAQLRHSNPPGSDPSE